MQHFLLSSAARTLSLKQIKMGQDAAYRTFCQLRWPETHGEAICPKCDCVETYNICTRRKFKYVGCHHQFSVTSGTIFASRKLSFTDLLAAIVIFVNGAKGVSATTTSQQICVIADSTMPRNHRENSRYLHPARRLAKWGPMTHRRCAWHLSGIV